MNKRGRTAAFVLGLIAGIFNIIYGIIVLAAGGIAVSAANTLASFFSLNYLGIYDMAVGLEWGILILFFLVSLLNLIGGCVVRGHRIAGGVMMLITSLLLLTVCFFLMAIPSAIGVVLLLYLPFQVLSLIASIIAFVPPKKPVIQTGAYQRPPYSQPQYAQSQFGQTPYSQPPYGQPMPPYQAYAQRPMGQQPIYNQQQYTQPQYGQPPFAPPPYYPPPQNPPQYNQTTYRAPAPYSPPPVDVRAAEAEKEISPDK